MDNIEFDTLDTNIPRVTKARWQNIVDTMAAVFEVPAVVITSVGSNNQEILISSQTQNNPFNQNNKILLSSNSYFNHVIENQTKLIILNSTEFPQWKDQSQYNSGMVSYLGFPIFWSTGEIFGTISILDSRERNFSTAFQDLLFHISTLINSDLQMIQTLEEMDQKSSVDKLTGLRNKKSLETDFEYEISRAVRYNQPLSVLSIDINNFRNINEFYGYGSGDAVLIETSDQMHSIKRSVDKLYRLDADDFMILLPDTPRDTLYTISERIRRTVGSKSFLEENISISLAISGTQWEQGEPLVVLQQRLDGLMKEVKGNSGALPQIG